VLFHQLLELTATILEPDLHLQTTTEIVVTTKNADGKDDKHVYSLSVKKDTQRKIYYISIKPDPCDVLA